MTLGQATDELLKWGADAVAVRLGDRRNAQITVDCGGHRYGVSIALLPGTLCEIDRNAVERIKLAFDERPLCPESSFLTMLNSALARYRKRNSPGG